MLKYFFVGFFILGLFFNLTAQSGSSGKQLTMGLGMHYVYHIIPPGDNVAEDIIKNSRIGMNFDLLFNLSSTISLGAEFLFDNDVISFISKLLPSDKTIIGLLELGGRAVLCYNAMGLKLKPLFGIRYVTLPFLASGYNLEAGLKLAFRINPYMEIEAEGCYYFTGNGDLFYYPQPVASLGFKYIF